MGKVLVVSFDGMDYDLINKFELEHVKQEEFGRIDNDTGVKVRVTSELFASFLTGETWEEHGIIGLKTYPNKYISKIEDFNKHKPFRKTIGLREKLYKNLPFLDARKRKVVKEDYEQETFLDKVEKSEDIGVRAYSKGYSGNTLEILEEFGIEESIKENRRLEKAKERELFEEIENGDADVVMAHFHFADSAQHKYWEIGKKEKVKQIYRELDELAGRIKKEADGKYELIIFMSDHGLPTENAHNKNAFYSLNKKLGLEKPHITDFHDIILEEAPDGEEMVDEIDI